MSEPGRGGRRARVAGAIALALALPVHLAVGAPLRGAATIRAIYGQVLDAEFDAARAAIAACDEAPREACDVLEAVRVWWQIQLDPESRALDPAFERAVTRAITAAEAWAGREPRSAEAWFYVGGAYGARVQWRVLRQQYLSAARDGSRVKTALERALEIDPSLEDAHFGIGLYQYYADVAPTGAKILRVLFLLPGGDRKEGLAKMQRTRDRGQVMSGEAAYQLHIVDLWYEKDYPRAMRRLEALERAHPRNPLFTQLIAEVEDVYFHDRTASLAAWQRLLRHAEARAVNAAGLAETRARLGAAAQLDAVYETDAAVDLLRPLATARTPAPCGAAAQAWLQLGLALDRIGAREQALTAYAAAIAAVPAGDPHGVRERARRAQREAPDATTARAYRLSLEGWRALERHDVERAERDLAAAIALRPEEPVTRYRLAQVRLAQRDTAAAQRELDRVLASPADHAPTIYARACVDAAQIREQQGERTMAIELYARAATIFGAADATRDAGSRAAARLRGGGR